MLPSAVGIFGIVHHGGERMNEVIRSWLLAVTGVSMMIAIAENLVSEGIHKKIITLAGGLALVLVTLAPVMKFDEKALMKEVDRFEAAVHDESEELKLRKDFLYESIIAERTQAYILDKANELGMHCQIMVSVAWNEELPIPCSVVVKGSWNQDQYLVLSEFIETDLGIPRTMQRFEEAGQ